MKSNNILMEVTNLSKSYDGKVVLDDVTLSIESNEFVAVVGKSGSGKSTLISILGLLESFDKGDYILSKHSVSNLTKKQISHVRNQNIGWIFQEFNLLNNMTVLENILLPTRYAKQTKNYVDSAKSLIHQLGLTDKELSYPGQLSGGQQQRVAIARALIMKPDVLFCDEPTGNLDSENAAVISKLLTNFHENGTTIVLVTHDEELAQSAERQIRISDGKLC